VILALACGPFVYYLLALWASCVYFRSAKGADRGQSRGQRPISILKPVRGLDREAYENFASFCLLDCQEYEILFCVNDADDPAVPVIEDLRRDFPERDIRLLIGAPHLGASGKVNKLCRLVQEAKYELLVISDSDVRVERNYLQEVSAPFTDPSVGAVTVFFRSVTGGGFGPNLDAAGSAVEFAASALLARSLEGIHFTLGATMATTKKVLAEIGGFEALANHYVDDYELGRRITKLGYRIELARTPVCMVYPHESVFQFLRHELRWSIGLRNVRPFGHAAIGLTLGLPWTILAVLIAPSASVALMYVLAYLVLRFAVYFTVGVWGLQDPVVRRKWWLAPVRDAATFAVWVASFFSNKITWRGLAFRVKKGILIPLDEPLHDSLSFSAEPSPVTASGKVLDSSLGRSALPLEPAIDFAARRAPRSNVGVEKTGEVG
jgi:ceramide glucosyltransferase